MQGVHPKFDRDKAQGFLDATDIGRTQTVREMSKGMVTQLHLAVAISIDAKLLVLDEPTLGLDILYRKRFYKQLLEDYFDEERTILVTTHQVEEIEALLTDLVFIRQGKVVLDMSMEDLGHSYQQLEVSQDQLAAARALNPIYEEPKLGGATLLFENQTVDQLAPLGQVGAPSVSDLFVAKMG